MNYKLKISILFLSVFACYLNGHTQNPDTTVLLKGRYITGLSGNITGQDVFGNNSTTGQNQKLNEYRIGTQSGYFIENKWVIGADFSLSKSASSSNQFDFLD